jgi:hypothetical protein
MTVPYDAWSAAVIAAAGVLFFAASRRSLPHAARVMCVLAAAFAIRLDPSWQLSLHTWDESIHAVVAKRLTAHPFMPTLYDPPALPFPSGAWTETGVWLHKPPLALWLIAASLATFGVDALVLRLPSILLSSCSVGFTYLIGRHVFDARVGLLAAGFQAVNGLLVSLVSGRRVADHVDTALIFCVEAGLLAIVSGLTLSRARRHAWLAGFAMGLGLLAKSLPALLILAVAAVAWQRALGAARTWPLPIRVVAGAIVVCGPWMGYTALVFPTETRQETAYTLRHISTVLEGHGGTVWAYVRDMPRQFGELIYVPVVAFLWSAMRRDATAGERAVAASLLIPYLVFSFMATKLTAFIAVAAPCLFLAQGVVWVRWRDRLRAIPRGPARAGMVVLLALLVALPARSLLEPTGPFERRDRTAATTRRFMQVDSELGPGDAVIFNVPKHYELMFYSRFMAYDRMPTEQDVAFLQAQGVRIVVYQPDRQILSVPAHWRAVLLPEQVSR